VWGVEGRVWPVYCWGRKVEGWLDHERTSKMGLGKIVWSSFRWLLVCDSVWMWNLSIVFRWGPFLWYCNICMISSMGPKECAELLRCFAKLLF
jgi:hypothetical protein